MVLYFPGYLRNFQDHFNYLQFHVTDFRTQCPSSHLWTRYSPIFTTSHLCVDLCVGTGFLEQLKRMWNLDHMFLLVSWNWVRIVDQVYRLWKKDRFMRESLVRKCRLLSVLQKSVMNSSWFFRKKKKSMFHTLRSMKRRDPMQSVVDIVPSKALRAEGTAALPEEPWSSGEPVW